MPLKIDLKNRKKDELFEKWAEFISTECWNEKEFGDGKYDRKMFEWFIRQLPDIITDLA